MFQVENNYQSIKFDSPDIKSISEEDQINEASNPVAPRRIEPLLKLTKPCLIQDHRP